MNVGEYLRNYLSCILPQEKEEISHFLAMHIFPLFMIFMYTANVDGKPVFSGYIKPNNVWTIEVDKVNYNLHYRALIFIEKDTNTTYYSTDGKKRRQKFVEIYGKMLSKMGDKKIFSVEFIPYYEGGLDEISRTTKSYEGKIVKISQGDDIIYEAPSNYIKELNSVIRKVEIQKYTIIFLYLIYLFATYSQIKILLRKDRS